MKKLPIILWISCLSSSLTYGQTFIAERGNYSFTIDEVVEQISRRNINYVSLVEDKTVTGAKYKLNPLTLEYQVNDWFLRDWDQLQDMFVLDTDAFIDAQDAKTFNEAKRKQYGKFPFDLRKYHHLKDVPSLKEWGGLTHPPVKTINGPLNKYDANYGELDYQKTASAYFDPSFQAKLDTVSGSELTFGNKLKIVADHHSFLAKKRLIRNAKSTIFMSALVFICDTSTKEIVDLLIKKHNEGLEVRIIVDGFISGIAGHKQCPSMLRKAGIEVIETNDFLKHNRVALYHTKTLVVDFEQAIAGGSNMLNADSLSLGTNFMNRDIDLLVTGPMVTDIATQFIENWAHHFKLKTQGRRSRVKLTPMSHHEKTLVDIIKSEEAQRSRGKDLYAGILNNPQTRMQGVCRFVKQAPYRDGATIVKTYLKLLDKVNHYLAISDPVKSDTYVDDRSKLPINERFDTFEMFNLLHSKVQEVARNGKKIDYLTTNINMAGNEFVAMANETIKKNLHEKNYISANLNFKWIQVLNQFFGKPHYENLLKDYYPHKNVHIWTHMSFLHSKVFYFDRIVSSIGSLNFQHNATDHSYESTAICMDESLNQQLDRVFVQDMANSIPLTFKN